MKKITVILFLTVFSCSLTAQTASIDSLDVCAAQEVILPVSGLNILNVGALTLYIGFDTINLVYDTILNVDPQIQGLTINLMTSPKQIACAWSNTTPINFYNNKLFDLKFSSNGNNASVTFNANCEISDSNGIIIPINYLNGAVISGLPQIIENPSDTTIKEGQDAIFSITANNTVNYLWRESGDNGATWIALDDNEVYSGTTTNVLTIHNSPLSFNNNLYQCLLSTGSCQVLSSNARLNVDEVINIGEIQSGKPMLIRVSPNPFASLMQVFINSPMEIEIEFSLFNETGQFVKRFPFRRVTAGIQHIFINADDLKNGIYFLKVKSRGYLPEINESVVVIKN